MVFGWSFMAFFVYIHDSSYLTLQVKYTSNALQGWCQREQNQARLNSAECSPFSQSSFLNSAKIQKKMAICKYLGQKVCVLTFHFAQIPPYIIKGE